MSAVVALLIGLGVFLVFDGATRPAARRRAVQRSPRLVDWLAECGAGPVRPMQFLAASAALAVLAGATALVLIGSAGIALVAAAGAGTVPTTYYRRRRRQLRTERCRAWPDAVDLLAGAVHAGDTLPAAIAVVSARGPEPLRPVFAAVVRDQRVSGDLVGALERMGTTVGDPVADRVTRTLVLAHRVGGQELGRVLRTLAAFLREDLATRREIASRQSWTVVAARVAAAAPWVVLLLVASRPQGASAFDRPAGLAVLGAGAAVTVVGYRLMLRIGRLPDEPRVLTGAAT